MKSTLIKKIIEEKVQVSEEKFENRVEIIFETLKQGMQVNESITLSGDGSVKVLMPV